MDIRHYDICEKYYLTSSMKFHHFSFYKNKIKDRKYTVNQKSVRTPT